jgi:transposase
VECRAGLDWAATTRALCVVDDADGVVVRLEVPYSAAGLAALIRRLARPAPASEIPITIERPSGLLVDTLLAAGKSDPGDAYVLADILRTDILRTDGHRFPPLWPCSDELEELRALARGRDDLVAERVALANRLRSLLDGFCPGASIIFAAIDSPIALAFVQRYPTPDGAAPLGETRPKAFLAQHRYSGRRSPAELLQRLRNAPLGRTEEAESDAKGELARALATVRDTLVAQITKLTARLEHAVAALADGRPVKSFPRAGRVCAAQILAEPGDVRERFPTEDQLAAEAGVCPVTHASGKSRGVAFRRACNHRRRQAVICFADNSRHACTWAA